MNTDMLDRYGYYVVCGQKYYNKLEAFKVAFSQGHQPHWYFHEDTFSKVDWTYEPEEDLSTLYKKRAEQLRNKYDKLILSFSGGTDSSTVADSFIYNGIKLDYLLNRNISYINNRRDVGTDEANFHNEPLFVALPAYERYKKLQPDLEYVGVDYIQRMIEYWENTPNADPYSINCYVPNNVIKDNILELFPQLANANKCVVHAIDKPIIFYINGRFYFTFFDSLIAHHIPNSKNLLDQNTIIEFFFWSTDAIDLMRKQAHAMKKYFKNNPHLLPLISNFPHRKIPNYRDIVAAAVYHPSKLDLWQPDKNKSMWLFSSEKWFFESDSVAYHNWQKFYFAFEDEARQIFQEKSDILYMDNEDKFKFYGEKLFNGLPGCYGKLYDIGE